MQRYGEWSVACCLVYGRAQVMPISALKITVIYWWLSQSLAAASDGASITIATFSDPREQIVLACHAPGKDLRDYIYLRYLWTFTPPLGGGVKVDSVVDGERRTSGKPQSEKIGYKKYLQLASETAKNGTYRCEVNGLNRWTKLPVKVSATRFIYAWRQSTNIVASDSVEPKISFAAVSPDQAVVEGSDINITCLTSSQNKHLIWYWTEKKNPQEVELISSEDNILHLMDVQLSQNQREYACYAYSAGKKSSRSTQLIVQQRGNLSTQNTNGQQHDVTSDLQLYILPKEYIYAVAGESVTVTCFASNTSRASVRWLARSFPQNVHFTRTSNGSMATATLIRVFPGKYKLICQGRSVSGRAKRKVKIDVSQAVPSAVPTLSFSWKLMSKTVLKLSWHLNSTSQEAMAGFHWLVSYRINEAGAWYVANNKPMVTSAYPGSIATMHFNSFSSDNIYRFQVVGMNHPNLLLDQMTYKTKILFDKTYGPISAFHFGLKGRKINCSHWHDTKKLKQNMKKLINRFLHTVCVRCKLYAVGHSTATCNEDGDDLSHLAYKGNLVYPGISRKEITNYLKLLTNGDLSVTLRFQGVELEIEQFSLIPSI